MYLPETLCAWASHRNCARTLSIMYLPETLCAWASHRNCARTLSIMYLPETLCAWASHRNCAKNPTIHTTHVANFPFSSNFICMKCIVNNQGRTAPIRSLMSTRWDQSVTCYHYAWPDIHGDLRYLALQRFDRKISETETFICKSEDILQASVS